MESSRGHDREARQDQRRSVACTTRRVATPPANSPESPQSAARLDARRLQIGLRAASRRSCSSPTQKDHGNSTRPTRFGVRAGGFKRLVQSVLNEVVNRKIKDLGIGRSGRTDRVLGFALARLASPPRDLGQAIPRIRTSTSEMPRKRKKSRTAGPGVIDRCRGLTAREPQTRSLCRCAGLRTVGGVSGTFGRRARVVEINLQWRARRSCTSAIPHDDIRSSSTRQQRVRVCHHRALVRVCSLRFVMKAPNRRQADAARPRRQSR